ncbi:MAG: hypothetical protein EHM70_06675 [Chloroflexota bacterium]|nr:MAG: hypothetical protein EHM70_06675 [Chloroflexota bacterium]
MPHTTATSQAASTAHKNGCQGWEGSRPCGKLFLSTPDAGEWAARPAITLLYSHNSLLRF